MFPKFLIFLPKPRNSRLNALGRKEVSDSIELINKKLQIWQITWSREGKIERVIAEQRDTKNFDYQGHKFK